MKDRPKDRLMWWVAGAFALMLGAWTVLFIVAAKHRVAEVPIVTQTPVH